MPRPSKALMLLPYLCAAFFTSLLVRVAWDWLGSFRNNVEFEELILTPHTNPCVNNNYCYLINAEFNRNGETVTTTQCFAPRQLSVAAVELGPEHDTAIKVLATCPLSLLPATRRCLPGLFIYKEPHVPTSTLADDVWIIFGRLWHLGEHDDAASVHIVMPAEHRLRFTSLRRRRHAEYHKLLSANDIVFLNSTPSSTSSSSPEPVPCFARLVVGWARDSVTFGSPNHLVHLPLVAAFRRRALAYAGVTARPEHRRGEQLCSVLLVATHIINAAELATALRASPRFRCIVDVVDIGDGAAPGPSLKTLVHLLAHRRVLVAARCVVRHVPGNTHLC